MSRALQEMHMTAFSALYAGTANRQQNAVTTR